MDNDWTREVHLAAIGANVAGPGACTKQEEPKQTEELVCYVEGNVIYPHAFGWRHDQ